MPHRSWLITLVLPLAPLFAAVGGGAGNTESVSGDVAPEGRFMYRYSGM